MKIKKLAFISALAISTLPLVAQADVNIKNNTNVFITAKAKGSCSSLAGDRGIIVPNGTLSISGFIIGFFCQPDCQGEVFATKDCSGDVIANVVVEPGKGVTNVSMRDSKHFKIDGGGDNIVISGQKSNSFIDWFKSIL